MNKYIMLCTMLLVTPVHAEYDAYKLTAAYELCGFQPLKRGSFELLKDTILEEQPKLALAMAGGEFIANAPKKSIMDKCTANLTKFLKELKTKIKEVEDAKN